ncbi:Flagellar hook capping protein [Candidatus Hydrogenisulfobacillus filiaventi]|uniref:Flagellar hook capping protein n=1 Tax=Candidatus Hydrogenisulfobacillus filiaventi TaxID=2707344 RepID=A0A6F8ZE23_9FIRM|nr:Flagellar hook capping protein [Candidatus Hydrogenisulfobacillus filiaventi]
MSVNPVPTLGTAPAGSSLAGGQVTEQDFLTLLGAELKYQDPLQPLSNTDFLAQLAQFSTLGGITDIEQTLKTLAGAWDGAAGLVGAAALIGKTVTTSDGRNGTVSAVLNAGGSLSLEVSGVGTVPVSSVTRVEG